MDEEAVMKTMATPKEDIKVVTAKAGDILQLGPVTCRIMEDGSNTSMYS